MDWAKTTARRDEAHLNYLEFGATSIRGLTVIQTVMTNTIWVMIKYFNCRTLSRGIIAWTILIITSIFKNMVTFWGLFSIGQSGYMNLFVLNIPGQFLKNSPKGSGGRIIILKAATRAELQREVICRLTESYIFQNLVVPFWIWYTVLAKSAYIYTMRGFYL